MLRELKSVRIQIGRFRITKYEDGFVWLEIASGEAEGEGMEINEKILESYIEKCYKNNF